MHPYNDPTVETPRQLSERLVLEALAKQPSPMREIELSFAYERASGVIESACASRGWTTEFFGLYYDLDDVDEDTVSVDEEAAYLDSRGLLDHHPDNPRWVSICDESEATR